MKQNKFLLDQMIDQFVSDKLRQQGYDVVRVSEIDMSRADDSKILERAIFESRALITLDEHFGDWAVLPLNTNHPGVIRIKVQPTTGKRIIEILLPFLRTHFSKEFSNKLIILSKQGIRWISTKTN